MTTTRQDELIEIPSIGGMNWRQGAVIGLGVLLTISGGALVGSSPSGWIIALGGFLGVLVALALMRSTQLCLLAITAVITLLPYAVIPIPLGGVKPTFLDASLLALLGVWVFSTLARRGDGSDHLNSSPLNLFVLAFVGLSFVSFFIGIGLASATPEAIRLYLKLVNSILLFFTVVNTVRTPERLRLVVGALVIGGGLSALIGIILFTLPNDLSWRLLSALRPLGYPDGPGVLRFIAGTNVERAISTQVDPNILGTLLMVAGAIAINQFFSTTPVLPRWLTGPLSALMTICLVLTRSRSSWIGFALALWFILMLRYRQRWYMFVTPVVLIGLLAYLVQESEALALLVNDGLALLQQNEYLGWLVSGLQWRDQAAAMRLGEYKDALVLINRYPWFGAGFGSSPDVDVYIGVSSMYLMITSTMGLVGLSVFLMTIGAFYTLTMVPLLLHRFHQTQMETLLISILAGLTGGLVSGIGDYHFFNPRFPHMIALFWLLVGLGIVTLHLGYEVQPVPPAQASTQDMPPEWEFYMEPGS